MVASRIPQPLHLAWASSGDPQFRQPFAVGITGPTGHTSSARLLQVGQIQDTP
jgi:hypothetical protein